MWYLIISGDDDAFKKIEDIFESIKNKIKMKMKIKMKLHENKI